MNEKEKESIEELRKQLRLAINIDDVTTTIRNDDAETILKLIEKLQKENEELKNQEATARRINELLVQRYSNSIPVQKVKDKIEELNSRIEIYRKYVEQGVETDVEWVDNVADRETVKVLQELIKEERKNRCQKYIKAGN